LAFKLQKPAAKSRPSRVDAVAPAAKRSSGKRRKLKITGPVKRTSKPQPKPTPIKRKKTKPAADRKRVQGGLDSDSGQHRLPKPKRVVTRRAKTRVASDPGSRKKLAA